MDNLTETEKYHLKMSLIVLESWDFRFAAMVSGIENGREILEQHQTIVKKLFPKMLGG